MALKIANRGDLPPFIVMDVMAAAAEKMQQGADVLHMEVGEPSLQLPTALYTRLQEKMQTAPTGYTVAKGVPALRQAIAGHYAAQGHRVNPDHIMVTMGSSCGFVLAFLAAFNPRDKVAMAVPGYPCYRHILTALGIEPVLIEVGPETRFQPTAAMIADLDVDGLIIASPSNPTGTILNATELQKLVDICREKGIRLISDEIYHGITYGEEAVSVADMWDEAIIINSFSKLFCMTGWRLGWMVVPQSMVRAVETLAQNLFISAPTVSQYAGILSFDYMDTFRKQIQSYRANRTILLEALPAMGLNQLAPADGAFYIYANVEHLTDNSLAFAKKILQETHIAVTPGVDFDPINGHKYIRFSFAGSEKTMRNAMIRLEKFLKS